MEECIPMGTIPSKPDLPWLTRDVLRISRKCNILYRRAKRTGKSRHINIYKLARNMSVKLLRNAEQSFFARLDNSSQKQFWKTMKHLCKTKSTVPALSHSGITPPRPL